MNMVNTRRTTVNLHSEDWGPKATPSSINVGDYRMPHLIGIAYVCLIIAMIEEALSHCRIMPITKEKVDAPIKEAPIAKPMVHSLRGEAVTSHAKKVPASLVQAPPKWVAV